MVQFTIFTIDKVPVPSQVVDLPEDSITIEARNSSSCNIIHNLPSGKRTTYLVHISAAAAKTLIDAALQANNPATTTMFTDALSYVPILQASGFVTATDVAGKYGLGNGEQAVVSGGNFASPLAIIYIDPANYPPVAGNTRTMKLSGIFEVNNATPTAGSDVTLGLYPVTRPASSGGAGVNIYTLGTVVSGSTIAKTSIAADDQLEGRSSAFAIPTAGWYAIGAVTTQTVATASRIHLVAQLNVQLV